MKGQTNTVIPPMNDEENRRAFLAEYEALCKRYGLNHAASPVLVGRDDGTYSIVVQWSVVPLPKQTEA